MHLGGFPGSQGHLLLTTPRDVGIIKGERDLELLSLSPDPQETVGAEIRARQARNFTAQPLSGMSDTQIPGRETSRPRCAALLWGPLPDGQGYLQASHRLRKPLRGKTNYPSGCPPHALSPSRAGGGARTLPRGKPFPPRDARAFPAPPCPAHRRTSTPSVRASAGHWGTKATAGTAHTLWANPTRRPAQASRLAALTTRTRGGAGPAPYYYVLTRPGDAQ